MGILNRHQHQVNFIELSFRINQTLIDFFFIHLTDTAASKLSTFSGKANVQMRRTTNKKGKTAPAPPKRTR